jgi:hypothetical protein
VDRRTPGPDSSEARWASLEASRSDGEGGLGPPHPFFAVTRTLTLHLDEFLQGAVDGYARERGDTPSSIVRTAARYWLADRDSGRPAWRAPRFRRDAGLSGESMRVGVDDETWEALEEEGRRQGLDAELLAEHALLYFLADLDSGRARES